MSTDIYDENLSLEMAGGNPQLAEQMLEMLCNNLPGHKTAINEALATGDLNNLYQQVHKVTGSTRYCGVPALADICELLDRQLKNGATEQLEILVGHLNTEIDRLVAFNSGTKKPGV